MIQRLTPEQQRQVDTLLLRWLTSCRVAVAAYNQATTRTAATERRLGVPAAALSALVATGVFATLAEEPALAWKIVTGISALAAAVLTALHTFLRLSERTEQYREAARAYGVLRRRIEQARLFLPRTQEEADALLDELRVSLQQAAVAKPNVPQKVWDRADFKVKGTCDARGLRAASLRIRDKLDFGVGKERIGQ
jgi:hypothetical protein